MSKAYPVISLFSGAMGLDLGLEAAGFQIRVAVECNPFAAATISRNRPNLPLIARKLEEVTTQEILNAAGLEKEEACLVIGGPSCQAFSTAGGRGSVGDPRGTMFRQFLRVVSEARPRFFLMENVRGVLSAAIRHRPLCKRGPAHPPLEPDEELGSAFGLILREIHRTGYYTVFDLLNAANFGVPQLRERLFFIGSRDGEAVSMPSPTHAKQADGSRARWTSLKQALQGLDDPSPAYSTLPALKKRMMAYIPEGGNWHDLPRRLLKEAMGGALTSWGGRTGFYRRLAWNEPTPALTTRPDSKATMLCHPTELRPLSVAEYARIQQFPENWGFEGGIPQQYKQVGNAVPLGLGKAAGMELRALMQRPGRRPAPHPAGVYCFNEDLVARMANRPRTILNPPRMRQGDSLAETREWTSVARGNNRRTEHLLFQAGEPRLNDA